MAELRLDELVIKLNEWKNFPVLFFEDIFGEPPSDDQAKFLTDMTNIYDRQYVLISAGRGTGKTLTLAILSLWYAYVLPKFLRQPIRVVVLAGSFVQAQNLYNYIKKWCYTYSFLRSSLKKEPTMNETVFQDDSSVRALTASEKQVRSPRGDLLIIDEAVEAGRDIIEASMQINIASSIPRTILSSTPHKFDSLFVDIFNKTKEYGFEKPYIWSGEDCDWILKKTLTTKKKMLSHGKFSIEISGTPYAFEGPVFPLRHLKNCVVSKMTETKGGDFIMGTDFGHYPAPTVGIVIQRNLIKLDPSEPGEMKIKVVHNQAYLKEDFEKVLDALENTAKTYQVQAIYVDSIPPGEGTRLKQRGLPVYLIKFKGEKPMMLSNLQAIIEKARIEIHEDDYTLISQLRNYRFDTKKEDDYVDALMLACKSSNPTTLYGSMDLSQLIKVGVRRTGGIGIRKDREVKKDDPNMCTKCHKLPKYSQGFCMDCFEIFLDSVR